MSVTVKFDPTSQSKQSQVIPNATVRNDGIMTKEQVQALDAAGGVPTAADVSYDDTLVPPPLGATTVQEAIDDLKTGGGNPVATQVVSGTVKLDSAALNPADPTVVPIGSGGTMAYTNPGTANPNGNGLTISGSQLGNSVGVSATGGGNGAGVGATGGATDGSYGVVGISLLATNANGVRGTASGTGLGVRGEATVGNGVEGESSTGKALQGTATGVGGVGVHAFGSVIGAVPGQFTPSATNETAIVADGPIEVNSFAPLPTVPMTDTITRKNLVNSWGNIFGVTVVDGYNVASATSPAANTVRITLAAPMADTDYGITFGAGGAASVPLVFYLVGKTSGTFDVQAVNAITAAVVALETPGAFDWCYTVTGEQ